MYSETRSTYSSYLVVAYIVLYLLVKRTCIFSVLILVDTRVITKHSNATGKSLVNVSIFDLLTLKLNPVSAPVHLLMAIHGPQMS